MQKGIFALKNEGEKGGFARWRCKGASESAHSRPRECALTGPRVRTHSPASARSFFTPSTGICSGGGRYPFGSMEQGNKKGMEMPIFSSTGNHEIRCRISQHHTTFTPSSHRFFHSFAFYPSLSPTIYELFRNFAS